MRHTGYQIRPHVFFFKKNMRILCKHLCVCIHVCICVCVCVYKCTHTDTSDHPTAV